MNAARGLALALVLVLGAAGLWLYGLDDMIAPELGPVDGHDLPAEELDRVGVGDEAPDFALRAYSGGVVRLSDFRDKKDVVLVFYRGHW